VLCAMTARKLKPGSYDDFRDAFMQESGSWPEAWVRFYAVRGVEDEDLVVTFGFYDGTLEELRASGQEGYEEQQERIAPYVESVALDGIFEIVEERER
jgi:hypothetical protein